MAEPIISVSGLRGIVGDTLTPDVAMRYATAFAAIAPPGDILVGRDSRPSGRMLSLAIHAALQAVGRTTIDAGIAATPTVGVLLRHFKAAAPSKSPRATIRHPTMGSSSSRPTGA